MYEGILEPCNSNSSVQPTIDAQLQQQVFAEKQKWNAITERIVEVISYLAKQNLALRGHRGEGTSGLSELEETIGDN